MSSSDDREASPGCNRTRLLCGLMSVFEGVLIVYVKKVREWVDEEGHGSG